MDKNAVRLKIFFARMNKFDTDGIIEITSEGYPDNFEYSGAGDIHRMYKNNIRTEPEMLAMCDEIKNVIQKYFPMGTTPYLTDLEKEI